MSLNSKCPDFEGRYKCNYFIANGACGRQTRFMCHIFIDTDKPPVEEDVPLFLKEVLETFPTSTVERENKNPWGFTKEAKSFIKAEAAAKNKAKQQGLAGVEQKGNKSLSKPKTEWKPSPERQKKMEDIFGKLNF